MTTFPPVPPEIKSVQHFLKVAAEHDDRNVVVAYWARMFACQRAMAIVPGKKSPEVSKLLVALMDWMENTKKANLSNEGIVNETIAHSLIEEYALQLFNYGDQQDRANNFNKNTIKAFYTAGILMDILEQFGTLTEDIYNKRKYAKWKAAYIHNCLKTGDIPIPGAPGEHLNNVVHRADMDNDDDDEGIDNNENPSPPGGEPGSSSASDFAPSVPFQPAPTPFTPPIQPMVPPVTPSTPSIPTTPIVAPSPSMSAENGATLGPDQIQKAQKYCKFATSALNYDDTKTAIANLQKALKLLQTGVDD